jgi:hypothetical protein
MLTERELCQKSVFDVSTLFPIACQYEASTEEPIIRAILAHSDGLESHLDSLSALLAHCCHLDFATGHGNSFFYQYHQ